MIFLNADQRKLFEFLPRPIIFESDYMEQDPDTEKKKSSKYVASAEMIEK